MLSRRFARVWFLPVAALAVALVVSGVIAPEGVVVAQRASPTAMADPWARGTWLQWGGPNRDFQVEATGLADSWPEGGPPVLWSRPLGTGHSAIIVDEGRLYTMYRAGNGTGASGDRWEAEESVIALDAKTGQTIWEHKYPSRREDFSFGAGPHSTPLVVGDRLFTIGTNQQLFAFDKRSGKVLWSHDLIKEFNSPELLIRPVVKIGLRLQPDRLSRHDHLQRRRTGTVGDGFPPERRRRGVEERRLPHVRRGADSDRVRRTAAARVPRRRHGDRRSIPTNGTHPLVARRTIPATISTAARRSGAPTTSSSCRRPTRPAAARSSSRQQGNATQARGAVVHQSRALHVPQRGTHRRLRLRHDRRFRAGVPHRAEHQDRAAGVAASRIRPREHPARRRQDDHHGRGRRSRAGAAHARRRDDSRRRRRSSTRRRGPRRRWSGRRSTRAIAKRSWRSISARRNRRRTAAPARPSAAARRYRRRGAAGPRHPRHPRRSPAPGVSMPRRAASTDQAGLAGLIAAGAPPMLYITQPANGSVVVESPINEGHVRMYQPGRKDRDAGRTGRHDHDDLALGRRGAGERRHRGGREWHGDHGQGALQRQWRCADDCGGHVRVGRRRQRPQIYAHHGCRAVREVADALQAIGKWASGQVGQVGQRGKRARSIPREVGSCYPSARVVRSRFRWRTRPCRGAAACWIRESAARESGSFRYPSRVAS